MVRVTDEDLALIHPLKRDPETGEPYLQLAPPYAHIVLTPQRLSDVPAVVENLNDPRIHKNLIGPPLPYFHGDAVDWLTSGRTDSEYALARIRAGKPFVEAVVTRAIRDISNSSIAEAKLIGDCCIDRHGFDDILDADLSERLDKENAAKATGDPTITWSVGDWIDPAHQGQGIMTAVIATLIREWCIPKMNTRIIFASAFMGNRASVRVFEKNGFRNLPDAPDVLQLPDAKGGGRMGLHRLEWRLEEQAREE
ncbi:hypothetical protein EXIGLDRAFT_726511 [Exidia glandulosa HHB12029]|uniref:N-acetyltransferase domain-containing protein n=1 Tax=Exidia glandulosa HHB12029 TaxID=1314781 RepID=A0A165MBH5_EXIGL|nr:hypothetical protein EXIGLDRAFT_726511 [Exidia glandulosa HHB12029]